MVVVAMAVVMVVPDGFVVLVDELPGYKLSRMSVGGENILRFRERGCRWILHIMYDCTVTLAAAQNAIAVQA